MESIRMRMHRRLAVVVIAGALGLATAPVRGQEPAAPQLQPRYSQPITVSMTRQTTRVLYEAVAKLAGINVLWDSETHPQSETATATLQLKDASLRDVLDKLAAITNTSWKVLSANTIFVARR